MSRRRVPRLFIILALCAGCGDTADPVGPSRSTPSGIEISPDSLEFEALGDTIRLSAQVLDLSGDPIPGAEVIWDSPDEAVVSVDSAGRAVSRGNGTGAVVAKAGSISDTASVEVRQVPWSISLDLADDTISVGDSVRGRIFVEDANGNAIAEQSLTWMFRIEGDSLSGRVGSGPSGEASIHFYAGTLSGRGTLSIAAEDSQIERTIVLLPGPAVEILVPTDSVVVKQFGSFTPEEIYGRDQHGNRVPGSLRWALRSEVEWISGAPVLADRAADSLVFPVIGFGTAHVRLELRGGNAQEELTIHSRASEPTVVEIHDADPSGVFTIVGYGLDDVAWTEASVGGIEPDLLQSDSASSELRVDVPDETCAGAAFQAIAGIPLASTVPLEVRLHREEELHLAPGDRVRFSPKQERCLRIAPESEGVYGLAFLDFRQIELNRTRPMPYGIEGYPELGTEWESLSVSSLPGLTDTPSDEPSVSDFSGEFAAPGSVAGPDLPDDVVLPPETVLMDEVQHTQAVEVGDTVMTFGRRRCGNIKCLRRMEAEVIRIYDDYLGLLVPVEQAAEWRESTEIEEFDRYYEEVPPGLIASFYSDVFGTERPVSGESELIYVLMGDDLVGGFAMHGCYIQIADGPRTDIFLHELAHCMQFEHGSPVERTTWAMEGGAELATWEFSRHFLGQTLSGETPHREFGDLGHGARDYPGGGWWYISQPDHDGAFTEPVVTPFNFGYSNSGIILHDWLARMVLQRGVDEREALAILFLGSLEQWYCGGATVDGCRGLVPRIRDVWPDFDPIEAGLTTLARYRSDGFLNGDLALPWLEIDHHRFLMTDPRRLVTVSAGDAETHTVRTKQSTYGIIDLIEDGSGAAFLIEDTLEMYEWLLIRLN